MPRTRAFSVRSDNLAIRGRLYTGILAAYRLTAANAEPLDPPTNSPWGAGFPEPNPATISASGHRHRLPVGYRVAKTDVLGGLHHEYRLEKNVA